MKIKFKDFLLDLIFPKFCLGCGREGNWLCRSCQGKIVLVKSQICPECGRLTSSGEYCPRCRFDEILVKVKGQKKPKKIKRRKPLQGIMVASYFEEGPIKELIHNFKYNHILELKELLGEMMADTLRANLEPEKNILIVPVPLYWLREKQRGYNQAGILTWEISQRLNLASQKILSKKRHTKRQVDLKGKDRRQNLRDVFKLRSGLDVKGKTIIVVDDIATTGTTLKECAKVLKRGGTKRVWGLVAARG